MYFTAGCPEFFLNTYLAHFLLKCQRELITEAFFVGPENKFRITLKKKTNMSSVYCIVTVFYIPEKNKNYAIFSPKCY
jgi:hypothetical protein